MWGWVVFYSAVLILVNALSVGAFGEFEYWFSMIKVSAIVVFILLGAAVLFGYHQDRPIGLENFRAYGGFLPNGMRGVWFALTFVMFSFLGSEVVAVSAGEAKDPQDSAARHANHAGAPHHFLCRRYRHTRGCDSLDANLSRARTSPSARSCGSSTCAHSRRRPHHQFRRAYRGALQHELQPLYGDANIFSLARSGLCA